MKLCWIPRRAGIPGNKIADKKKAREASRWQEEMIACPCQDLFPYINDAIHEKLNTEWNEINDELKTNETRYLSPEKNRCRNDETVINRLRAGHTLLTHGYLIESLPVPGCELCHSHAMTVNTFFWDFECSSSNKI